MTITLIGAGNVGFHLGKRLHKKGFFIDQVYSRKLKNARFLANQIGAKAVNEISAIDAKSTIYVIAVHDDAIEVVAKQLSENLGMADKLVVHTSGAVSSEIIAKYFKHHGVFYPLQTFSKTRKVRFSNIPICVDATMKKDLKALKKVGKKISKKVAIISDKERAILHIAAVFVNNFTNHLFYLGKSIVEPEKIDFDLLKPLIKETVLKIENQSPLAMQTGPAKRKDQLTLKKHIKYLKKFPDYAQLYTLLTKSIQNAHHR